MFFYLKYLIEKIKVHKKTTRVNNPTMNCSASGRMYASGILHDHQYSNEYPV